MIELLPLSIVISLHQYKEVIASLLIDTNIQSHCGGEREREEEELYRVTFFIAFEFLSLLQVSYHFTCISRHVLSLKRNCIKNYEKGKLAYVFIASKPLPLLKGGECICIYKHIRNCAKNKEKKRLSYYLSRTYQSFYGIRGMQTSELPVLQ